MKLPISKKESMTPNEFFGKLFQIRNQIHLTHLKVTGVGSYASHKALNEFYDGVDHFHSLKRATNGNRR